MRYISTSIKNLKTIVNTIQNWYDVLQFRSGLKRRITIITRRGDIIEIKNKDDYINYFNGPDFAHLVLDCWKNQYKDRIKVLDNTIEVDGRFFAYKNKTEYYHLLNAILHIFIENEYNIDILGVQGKTVIDIGANIGDTAIYFVSRAALEVIGFEPMPSMFERARENVRLNRLDGSITIFNMAVGKEKGILKLPELAVHSYFCKASSVTGTEGREVPVITLDQIVKTNPGKRLVLKMDIGGSEYEIMQNTSNETLSRFDTMVVECHTPNNGKKTEYKPLVDKFRNAGFKTKIIRDLIYAWK